MGEVSGARSIRELYKKGTADIILAWVSALLRISDYTFFIQKVYQVVWMSIEM